MRVIAGLSDITFSGNAQVSLAQAKDEIFALIHDETSRHEEELELAMALYEANIRVENKYHKSRIIELDRIRDMLNKCALDWGCLPKG
jgi:aromatic ring-opening dioxygenase LigB subunit